MNPHGNKNNDVILRNKQIETIKIFIVLRLYRAENIVNNEQSLFEQIRTASKENINM